MANFGNAKAASVGTSEVILKSITTATLITGCNLTNKTASSASISLYVVNGGNAYYIFKDKQINGNTNAEAIIGNKIVLVSGDSLRVQANLASAFDVIVSTLDGF